MSRLVPLIVLQLLLCVAGCASAPAQPATPPPPPPPKPLDAKAQKIELCWAVPMPLCPCRR